MPVILQPGSWLAWIVVGLIAGALASRLVRGKGMGCVTDLVIGVLGAFVGGTLLSLLWPHPAAYGLIGTTVVATLGAVVLLLVVRAVVGRA